MRPVKTPRLWTVVIEHTNAKGEREENEFHATGDIQEAWDDAEKACELYEKTMQHCKARVKGVYANEE